MKTLYYETGSTDPAYNLAFEEFILRNKTSGNILILWQNENAVIIGLNQNTQAEINPEFIEKHGIQVVRRNTGGGAVYHDLGNLNYSFITNIERANQVVISLFAEPIVNALRSLGLNAEASGRNDIQVDGKKVSGTAQRILNGRILFHGTLLFDSNPEMIAGALNPDPEKFKSKASKSIQARVGNIKEFLDKSKSSIKNDNAISIHEEEKEFSDELKIASVEDLKNYIKNQILAEGCEATSLSAGELEEILKLKEEKYDTWEWNYGNSPKFTYSNKKHFGGGTLETRVNVAHGGTIEDIAFYGDFLATGDMGPAIESLKGLPFRRDAVKEKLLECDLISHFGQIKMDEILSVLFEDR